LGESQVVALVDVHGKHNGQILDVAGVCVNRIGTVWGIRPKIIGNTHKHLIISENTTYFVGTALLKIYKWTGFKFLIFH